MSSPTRIYYATLFNAPDTELDKISANTIEGLRELIALVFLPVLTPGDTIVITGPEED